MLYFSILTQIMLKIISIPFEFEDKEYYSLIRFNYKRDPTELNVTVMNPELEKILDGNNTFQYKNGFLIVDVPIDGSELCNVKLAIIQAMENYLSDKSHMYNLEPEAEK
jgi:hypothetical protein